MDPRDHDHWLVGTSYDGLYRTTDAGASWSEVHSYEMPADAHVQKHQGLREVAWGRIAPAPGE